MRDGGIIVLAAALLLGAGPSDPEARIRQDVAVLASDALAGRLAGSAGGRAAADLVASDFREAGLDPAFQEFTFPVRGGHGGATGRNVVARLGGGAEAILIGAHYDHVGTASDPDAGRAAGDGTDPIWNGADDNASGTAVMLEAARLLAERGPHRRAIWFVAFDAEEQGLFGSAHFAAHLDADVRLMINLDMVGRNPDAPLQFHGVDTVAGGALRRAVAAAAEARGLAADLRSFGDVYNPDSDHHPFIRHGIPAMAVFSGYHEDYHRPSDEAGRLDYPRMAALAQAVADVAAELADAPEEIRFSPARRLGVTGRPQGASVLVEEVADGSAAARAGIRQGDELVSFNAQAFSAQAPVLSLRDMVRYGDVSRPAEVELIRSGERLRLTVQWNEDP